MGGHRRITAAEDEQHSDTAEILSAALACGGVSLTETESKKIAAAFGIAVPRGFAVRIGEDLPPAMGDLKPPFVLKVSDMAISHKSDAGGVRLGLNSSTALIEAMEQMKGALARSGHDVAEFRIEETAPAGHELVVGGLIDAQFGPVVMVGLGGIFVEIFEDLAFRICPIDEAEALRMLSELKAAPVFLGARGGLKADEAAIVDVLQKVGGANGLLMAHAAQIAEIDMNPLIASAEGAVAADVRIILRRSSPEGIPSRIGPVSDPIAYYKPLMQPRTIAVLGASTNRRNRANHFIDQVRAFGFEGEIFPIHPTASVVEGIRAYRSLADTPDVVDYAYVCIPASQVSPTLKAAKGRVRFAHVISSGFAEVEGGQELQDDLVAAARDSGIRVLGPNCLGLHSPRGRTTFVSGADPEAGTVGVIMQSGGLSSDVISRGKHKGVRFSSLVSLGNGADVGITDLTEYYLADPNTNVIGIYLEGLAEGRRLLSQFANKSHSKPLVLLKGGRSAQGMAAAASHTGTLAGNDRIWSAFCRQTGAAMTTTLDAFVDALLTFQMLRPRWQQPTRRAVPFGNGGGASVLAADAFARYGFDVLPFDEPTRRALEQLNLGPGMSLANPIDISFGNLSKLGAGIEAIVETILDNDALDVLVVHLNMAVLVSQAPAGSDLMSRLLDSFDKVTSRYPGRLHVVMVLRSSGDPALEAVKHECRRTSLRRGIPVFDEIAEAVAALRALADYEQALFQAFHQAEAKAPAPVGAGGNVLAASKPW